MSALRTVLENPPPLTPGVLRNFPYRTRAFPAGYLIRGVGLWPETAGEEAPAPKEPEQRVE